MESNWERIAANLSGDGYHIDSNFLNRDEVAALVDDFGQRHARGEFRCAGVGRGSALARDKRVRRDEICWFSDSATVAQEPLRKRLNALKTALNERLFLGLWDWEGHYALYPPGGFYQRHVDRFRDDDRRLVSLVVYLNASWQPGDGGELLLHATSGEIRVEPRAGTMVCFLSDSMEHEVLTARIERRSFAGWLRRRV